MALCAGERGRIAAHPIPGIAAARSGDGPGGDGIVHPGDIVGDCGALTEGHAADMRGGAEQQSCNDTNSFSHSAIRFAGAPKSLNRSTASYPVDVRRDLL